MAGAENIYLGIGPCGGTVHVVSSLGQRSAISIEGAGDPDDWIELATYGLPLPDPHVLYACVALPSGVAPARRRQIQESARQAGWDGVLVVTALAAARRAVSRQGKTPLTVVVVDRELTSVGLLADGLLAHDRVRPIAGREAREAAVSLRCLLKPRGREEVRRLLKRVIVCGDPTEIERVGRRAFQRELEGLGADQIEFLTAPFTLAEGAAQLARETDADVWRRLKRRRRS